MSSETIFAPATASGIAGIAVIRISGPRSAMALESLTGRPLPAPRRAVRRRLQEAAGGGVLDDGLVLWFPGPASFTGEDVAELHIHGGRATLEAVCAALAGLEGCRLAEPGEFSRRAFENDKLDLSEVEGLADLVAAETETQRRQAIDQLGGALGELVEGWRVGLIAALARVEAAIDFPDEDLPDHLVTETKDEIMGIKREILQYLDDSGRGERIRDGVHIAILGAPNVGKSSLLNALARRDVAIVSEVAGTTRDVIEVRLDLGGVLVTVADTAGLRAAGDAIEVEGVRRALARAERADLRLVVFDASAPALDSGSCDLIGPDSIPVVNKIDLLSGRSDGGRLEVAGGIPVSVLTGENLDSLIGEIQARVGMLVAGDGPPPLTRLRHRRALEECVAALSRATAANAIDLVADDIRLGVRAIGRITGRVDVEDVLDVIFAEFCIGK